MVNIRITADAVIYQLSPSYAPEMTTSTAPVAFISANNESLSPQQRRVVTPRSAKRLVKEATPTYGRDIFEELRNEMRTSIH